MNMFKMISSFIVVAMAALCLVGCNGKETAINVIQSTYTVSSQIQLYVGSLDSTNLVQRLQAVKTPMSAVCSALTFVKPYISDSSVSSVSSGIDSIIASINEIVLKIDTVDSSTVGELRQSVLDKLASAKETLVSLGSYLGAEIKLAQIKGKVTIGDINIEVDKLNGLMK